MDVEQLQGLWRVTVDHSDPPEPTVIETPDHHSACVLAGEVVFIASDPLTQMLRLPSAPDGPRDGGGGG